MLNHSYAEVNVCPLPKFLTDVQESDVEDFKVNCIADCNSLIIEIGILFHGKKSKDLIREIEAIRKRIEKLSENALREAFFSVGKPFQTLKDFIDTRRSFKNEMEFWRDFLKDIRNSSFLQGKKRLSEIREIIRTEKAKHDGGAVFMEASNGTKKSHQTPLLNRSPEIQETPIASNKAMQKVDAIACRVGNILGSPTESHVPELERMLERLNAMESSDGEVIEKIDATRARIQNILMHLTEIKNKAQEVGVAGSLPEARDTPEDISEDKNQETTYPQNLVAIEYIDNLLGSMTYRLSSTKKNSANTCGDGSFVTKILRPLLHVLRNELLAKNMIDAHMTSWNEIAERHETHVHNPYKGITSFVGLLKKSETRKDLQTLLQNELVEVVETFSGVWVANKGRSLRNVVEALRNQNT